MKKVSIILALLSALLLLGYGCNGKKEKKADTPVEPVKVDDKGIAFEVFQRIPKVDLDERFQKKEYTCPEDCRRRFGDSESNDKNADLYLENGGNHSFSVNCFPLNDGGWLALLINEGCFEGCKQTVRTYQYKDNVLNYVSDVLPRPTMEEMIVDPFILCGIEEWEMNNFRAEWNSRVLYYVSGDDILLYSVNCLSYDDLFEIALRDKKYAWNGETFEEINSDEDYTFNIIDYYGLGSIKLGNTPPESIAGYNRLDTDRGLLYSLNGQQMFKTELDGDGKVEAIDVYAKGYAHYGTKIGDTLFRLAEKEGFKTYFKDSTFVVTDDRGSDNCCIDYVGPNDAINGNFVEGLIANPKIKPDATVQYIRIYKPHQWENDTCDMQALKAAMDEASLFDDYPDCLKAYYDINSLYYFRELYNHNCDGYCDGFQFYLRCYPMKSGGFKVYVTTEWQPGDESDDVDAGYSPIQAFIYKDGKVTEAEVEPGMNDFETNIGGSRFAKVSGIDTNDKTINMTFEDESEKKHRIEYTWDGTAMRKTYEGPFDN